MEKDLALALKVITDWVESVVNLPLQVFSIAVKTITLPLRFITALFE